jgi:hypothetical protein
MSEENPDAVFGALVGRGIARATPVVFVAIVLILWLFTDRDFSDALRTGILPGILFGVFAGGFIGTLGSVWNEH